MVDRDEHKGLVTLVHMCFSHYVFEELTVLTKTTASSLKTHCLAKKESVNGKFKCVLNDISNNQRVDIMNLWQ